MMRTTNQLGRTALRVSERKLWGGGEAPGPRGESLHGLYTADKYDGSERIMRGRCGSNCVLFSI